MPCYKIKYNSLMHTCSSSHSPLHPLTLSHSPLLSLILTLIEIELSKGAKAGNSKGILAGGVDDVQGAPASPVPTHTVHATTVCVVFVSYNIVQPTFQLLMPCHRMLSSLIPSHLILFYPILSYPIRSLAMRSHPMPYLVLRYRLILSHHTPSLSVPLTPHTIPSNSRQQRRAHRCAPVPPCPVSQGE